MADILNQPLRPSADAMESPVGDETVILHLKDGIYYGLDRVGTRIWSLLRDGVPLPDICRTVAGEFDVPLTTVEEDARRFLTDLKANDILVEA